MPRTEARLAGATRSEGVGPKSNRDLGRAVPASCGEKTILILGGFARPKIREGRKTDVSISAEIIEV
jgi:hypothetical protein